MTRKMCAFLIVLGAALVQGCTNGNPTAPAEEDQYPIKRFNRNSYFPIVDSARWTYNNGATVTMSRNVSCNSFSITNLGDQGHLDGTISSADLGFCAKVSYSSGSDFIGMQLDNDGTPRLLDEEGWVSVGRSWNEPIYQVRWFFLLPISIKVCGARCTYTSMDGMITTAGGQSFSKCVVLEKVFYDEEDTRPPSHPVKSTYYIKKGIGYVAAINSWANGRFDTTYVVSYYIP